MKVFWVLILLSNCCLLFFFQPLFPKTVINNNFISTQYLLGSVNIDYKKTDLINYPYVNIKPGDNLRSKLLQVKEGFEMAKNKNYLLYASKNISELAKWGDEIDWNQNLDEYEVLAAKQVANIQNDYDWVDYKKYLTGTHNRLSEILAQTSKSEAEKKVLNIRIDNIYKQLIVRVPPEIRNSCGTESCYLLEAIQNDKDFGNYKVTINDGRAASSSGFIIQIRPKDRVLALDNAYGSSIKLERESLLDGYSADFKSRLEDRDHLLLIISKTDLAQDQEIRDQLGFWFRPIKIVDRGNYVYEMTVEFWPRKVFLALVLTSLFGLVFSIKPKIFFNILKQVIGKVKFIITKIFNYEIPAKTKFPLLVASIAVLALDIIVNPMGIDGIYIFTFLLFAVAIKSYKLNINIYFILAILFLSASIIIFSLKLDRVIEKLVVYSYLFSIIAVISQILESKFQESK